MKIVTSNNIIQSKVCSDFMARNFLAIMPLLYQLAIIKNIRRTKVTPTPNPTPTSATTPTPTPGICNGVEDDNNVDGLPSNVAEAAERFGNDPDTPQPPGVVCQPGEDESSSNEETSNDAS
jgi:hypothetical protein